MQEISPNRVDDQLPELPADPRETQLSMSVARLLTEDHILQRKIDDSVSREAFPKYLEQLDGGKLFLLKEQTTALEKYADKMDDEILDGDLVLARKGAATMVQRREIVAKVISSLLAKPFDFTVDERVETDSKKLDYAQSEADLTDRWRKLLKLQVLERIEQLEEVAELQAKKPAADAPAPTRPPEKVPPTFEGKEEKARTDLATRYATRFKRWADLEPLEPAELFLTAVTAVYDPHTTYLAPAEKENFDIELSGSLEGIGAALGEDDHFIVVKELIPGGASWQQGKLEAGDLILAVAQQGEAAVDVTDMPIDKVVKMIRGKKGTVVTLTAKKADGRVEDISITRDVVKIEASYARGAVLDMGKSGQMGYVYLPGFYGDTRSAAAKVTARNATDDVRAFLDVFEEKKLAGVIVDLRGNGGGLLGHARDIAGLFIETGAVVQTQSPDGKVEVLSDTDPKVSFSGNVVVMTDRFSASASEILAGALQDYQRAVIVGTGPTHGKGTVQALIDLDRLRTRPTRDSLGVLKLTIEQYFRVNGESTQWRGVVPDVQLPDPASFVDSGERTLFHSIPWSKVDPLPFKAVNHTWDKAKLAEASGKRRAAEPVFAKVETFGKLIRTRRDETSVPLERNAWMAERKKNKEALDAADPKISESKPRFKVVPVDDGQPKPTPPLPTDKDKDKGKKKSRLDKWSDDLARDPWVEESIKVLGDMGSKK